MMVSASQLIPEIIIFIEYKEIYPGYLRNVSHRHTAHVAHCLIGGELVSLTRLLIILSALGWEGFQIHALATLS